VIYIILLQIIIILLIVLLLGVVGRWYWIQLDIIQQFFNRQDDKFMEYFQQIVKSFEKHIEETKEAHTGKKAYELPKFGNTFIPEVGKVIRKNPLSSLWYMIKIAVKHG